MRAASRAKLRLLGGAGGCARGLAPLCILWGLLAMGFDWREGSLGGMPRIVNQTLGSIQAARRATGAGGEMGWAVRAPMRASIPSETISASFMLNSVGNSAL